MSRQRSHSVTLLLKNRAERLLLIVAARPLFYPEGPVSFLRSLRISLVPPSCRMHDVFTRRVFSGALIAPGHSFLE